MVCAPTGGRRLTITQLTAGRAATEGRAARAAPAATLTHPNVVRITGHAQCVDRTVTLRAVPFVDVIYVLASIGLIATREGAQSARWDALARADPWVYNRARGAQMISRRVNVVAVVAALVTVVTVIPGSVAGQTSAAGEKTWTPPRTADGQPDIQGFWANQGRRLATYNIQAMDGASDTHSLISGVQSDAHSLIVDPPDGKIPYLPWAQAKRQDIFANHNNPTKWEHVDPHTLCWLSGIPRMFYQGVIQIAQVPGYVVILQEFNHAYRIIHLDGRAHPPANMKLWMGDSRGRWEGNTMHVDVSNKNDKTRFDIVADFHADSV